MIAAVHQFLPAAEPGAVAAHALEVQRIVRELGLRSDIYADHIRPPFDEVATFYGEYAPERRKQKDDVLLYHHAIGSWVGVYVQHRPEPLLVDYHNVTPPALAARWMPEGEHGLQWGGEQLRALAGRTTAAFSHSCFSDGDVADAGYRRREVVPVLVDIEAMAADADAATLDRLRTEKDGGGADWLFVGRVAPHKAAHDLVRALAVHRRVHDPRARLHVVGGWASDAYAAMLLRLADDLGIGGAVRLTGAVPASVLAAHYRAADVFVCVSDHEGFCVPLLEAMHHDLPVVAYAAAAVPETVADAALLLPSKEPALVAAAADRVVRDEALRAALVDAGRRRLADLALPVARVQYRAALESALEAV